MRGLPILLVLLLLEGCSTADWSYDGTRPEPVSNVAATNYAVFNAETDPDEARCRTVAQARSHDATYQLLSDSGEAAIYGKIYDDCMTWLHRDQK